MTFLKLVPFLIKLKTRGVKTDTDDRILVYCCLMIYSKRSHIFETTYCRIGVPLFGSYLDTLEHFSMSCCDLLVSLLVVSDGDDVVVTIIMFSCV